MKSKKEKEKEYRKTENERNENHPPFYPSGRRARWQVSLFSGGGGSSSPATPTESKENIKRMEKKRTKNIECLQSKI